MITKSDTWHSPTLCGCVLSRRHTWRVSAAKQAELATYHPDDPEMVTLLVNTLNEQGQFDEVGIDYSILRQCPSHAVLSADEVAAEFLAYTQTQWRPETCGCAVSYTTKRDGSSLQVLNHPVHTRVCEQHQQAMRLTAGRSDGRFDAQAHFDLLRGVQHPPTTKKKSPTPPMKRSRR